MKTRVGVDPKHWHIVASDGAREAIAIYRYDEGIESIYDYVEIAYQLFERMLDYDDKHQYVEGMLKLCERFDGYHIYTSSPKLNLSWMDCTDDPCAFSTYN
jgi:hypothetical protein